MPLRCAKATRRSIDLPRCARVAGVENLLAKHQGMNPTASFKDTGMTFAASSAHQGKFRWVACASTGNTSASMAAYAARGNMHSLVLIPDGKISWGKLSQSLDYGALTCQLRTDFDGCVQILNELVRQKPVYLLNSVNPYRIEGQKTAAIELMEQLAWEPPDHIIVPGGNLGNSSAIGKALVEMRELKLISRLPKLSIIQAQGANPFYRCVHEFGGKKLEPMTADTLATAIRIGNPASWKKALRVLQATGGEVEQVTEVEIAIAKAEIGADGIGCEPASAVTLAGLKKLRRSGFVKAGESVVLILTGHLLKDPRLHHQVPSRRFVCRNADATEAAQAKSCSARRLCSMRIWELSLPPSRRPREIRYGVLHIFRTHDCPECDRRIRLVKVNFLPQLHLPILRKQHSGVGF